VAFYKRKKNISDSFSLLLQWKKNLDARNQKVKCQIVHHYPQKNQKASSASKAWIVQKTSSFHSRLLNWSHQSNSFFRVNNYLSPNHATALVLSLYLRHIDSWHDSCSLSLSLSLSLALTELGRKLQWTNSRKQNFVYNLNLGFPLKIFLENPIFFVFKQAHLIHSFGLNGPVFFLLFLIVT
jgi:hypothetical protein